MKLASFLIATLLFTEGLAASEVVLKCNARNENSVDYFIRFDDITRTLEKKYDHEIIAYRKKQIVHWSDKLIIFSGSASIDFLKEGDFNSALSALDRYTGEIQTVWVSEENWARKKTDVYIHDCEIYKPEKPKF